MPTALVSIIDDDAAVREAIDSLLRSIGLDVAQFQSPMDYLAARPEGDPSCLVLDMRMPGMSGLDFQRRLKEAGDEAPIIFLSGHADVPAVVSAMKAGAVEFLTKPFREQDLLDAISVALERDAERRREAEDHGALQRAYERLTPREREVMAQVTDGQMNKQIAARLGLSEVTVKMHRGRVMRKMRAMSVAEPVRMAERLGVAPPARSAPQAAAVTSMRREA